MDAHSASFRPLSVLLSGLLLINPWLAAAQPLVIDNTAGGNTRLNAAGNGVPIIDITTPSSNGLSHNQFREYNVGSEGLILNNSTHKLQSTELGGYIQGNPNLNGRAAQVILNEVTGSNRSALKGYTEVAGSAAQVIVANPHGMTCEGCGFINTPKVTLTTGTPIIKDGQLKQYDVNGGDILMDGAGIDARTIDAFELITRSARINAALHANHLSIVTGRNRVDADTLQATAKADDGSSKPLLAIDSSALGGMYAGAIKLVGTEDGVGVKLSGDMAASSADIEIDANGKLTVIRSAAGRDMRLNAAQVSLKDEHYAAGEVKITTAVLEVDKALASGGDMRLSAERLDNHGVLEAGLQSDGRANEKAQLRVESRALNNHGGILSHGDMQLQAANIDNHTGSIKAGGHVQLNADRLNNQSGQVFAEKALNIEIKQTDNQQGQLLAGSEVEITGEALDNRQGTVVAAGTVKLHLTDKLTNNNGLVEAEKNIELQTTQLNNANGQLRALDNNGSSRFVIGGTLINDNGQIEVANSVFNLMAETFSQNTDGKVLALGELQLAGNQWNNQGQIRTGGALTLNLRGKLNNQGLLASSHTMRLSAANLFNQQGLIYSLGDLKLEAGHLTNWQGDIYTQGALSFVQDNKGNRPIHFSNLSGTVESGGDITIIAEQIDNAPIIDNLIERRKIAAQFYNSGCTDCSGDKKNVTWHLREIDRTFAHSDVPGSALLSGGNLYLQGQTIRNDYSRLAAAGDIQLKGERFISRGAILGDTVLERWVQSARLKSRRNLISRVNAFNARHWPIPADAGSTADISDELDSLLGSFPTIEWRSATVNAQAEQPYQALVQAGGNVLIEADQIGNTSVQPSLHYVSGGKRSDGAIGTPITPSDWQDTLQRQRIDLANGARLPTSAQGLFVPSRGSRYLIETNPALASLRGYLNSDYLLRQLGYNPDTAQRRLGDGLYEQRLIRSALMSQNGLYYQTAGDEATFKQLMDNGIAAAQRLQLTPGIALSAEQVAALTQDMVWLEEREVGGETVLAPVLYLAQGSTGAVGSVIRGSDVRLLSETLKNSGTLAARRSLQVFAGQSIDNAGQITAGGALALLARQDIDNTGRIEGESVQLWTTDGDIRNLRRIDSHSSQGNGISRQQSLIQPGAQIVARSDLQLQAAGRIENTGSQIEAGGHLSLYAGRDLTLQASQAQNSQSSGSGKRYQSQSETTHYESQIRAGGLLSAQSGGDLLITGSRLQAGQDIALASGGHLAIRSVADETHREGRSSRTANRSDQITQRQSLLQAAGNLRIDSAKDVDIVASVLKSGENLELNAGQDIRILSAQNENYHYAFKQSRSTFSSKSREQESYQSQNVGSTLTAGSNLYINTRPTASGLQLNAGRDVTVIGSNLSAEGDLWAGANRDLNLYSGNNETYQRTERRQSKSGLSFTGNGIAVSTAKRTGEQSRSRSAVASEVLAEGNAFLYSGRDLNIQGGRVSAQENLNLQSGRDLTVRAANNEQSSSHWKTQRQSGIELSSDRNGYTAFIGNDKRIKQNEYESQTAAASLLYSGQDLTARAGRDMGQIGSDLMAEGDIDLQAARHIEINAAEETQRQAQQTIHQRNGLTVNISHNYGNTQDAIRGAGKGEDNISRASSTLKAIDSVSQFTSGPSNSMHMGNKAQIQQNESRLQTSRASTQQAGRDIRLQAGQEVAIKGGQQQAGRDLLITGETIRIDVAKGGLQEESSQTTRQSGLNSSASSTNARGGIGASYGNQTSESTQALSQPSSLQAARHIDLMAKQDLLLRGVQAQAEGDIRLKAGNDLNILAAQNQSQQQTNRHSGGGEVGIGLGSQDGISLYASVDYGKGNLDRQAAKQQNTDIRANGTLQLESGQDTTIAGAHLQGQNLDVQTGRNLLIASTPDSGKVSGKAFDASVTVSIGYGSASVSGSVGFGKTEGKTDWIEEQTALIAKDRLNIHTENHTQIDAALINSESGHLLLDTHTLGYSHHQGQDREHGWYLNAGGSYSFTGSNQQNPAKALPDKSQNDTSGNNSWNLRGYDYQKDRQQSVLATIGEGQIIVRNDLITGNNSLIGINRDIDNTYQITRDYSRNTQFYLSSTSTDAIQAPRKTLAKWEYGLSNYALNGALSFSNLGILAKQAEDNAKQRKGQKEDNKTLTYGIQALAWIPKVLVKTSDFFDTPTQGLFPGVDNFSGVYIQIPELFFGNIITMRSQYYVKGNNGLVDFDKNDKTQKDRVVFEAFNGKFNKTERIGINGILNNMELAAKNVAEQTGGLNNPEGNLQLYNIKHGGLGDLLESGFDKFFGLFGVRSAAARGINRFLNQVSQEQDIKNLTIAGHSQGSLLLVRGLEGVKFNQANYDFLGIQLSGAPVDAIKAHKVVEASGFIDNGENKRIVFQINRPSDTIMGGLRKTDFVADILGGNYRYSENPTAYQIGGWFSFPALLTDKSPHSNYSCSVCDPKTMDHINRQLRERFINPTLIDKDGNYRKRD